MKLASSSKRALAKTVIVFCFWILLSCNGGGCPPDESVVIVFADSSGRDLLNYKTPEHFYKKNIKVYTYTNNVKKLFLDSTAFGNLYPDPYNNFQPITFWVSAKTFLLQLSPSITDTIVVVNKPTSCPTIIDKVWYNGVLVHSFNSISLRQKPIKILK